MLVLALDTTSEWGGAAVFREGICLAAARHQGAANYSVSLFEDVDRLLGQLQIELRDINLFAAAAGPGSFTGIRVGLAAAQGWARAFERPVRGIPVLEALAEAAQAETPCVFPVLDARRGEFYAGAFRRDASGRAQAGAIEHDQAARLVASAEAVVLKPDDLARYFETQLKKGEAGSIVVRENDAAAQSLRGSLPACFEWKTTDSFLVPSIARLALLREQDGRAALPQELSAFYVRRSDAELHWKE